MEKEKNFPKKKNSNSILVDKLNSHFHFDRFENNIYSLLKKFFELKSKNKNDEHIELEASFFFQDKDNGVTKEQFEKIQDKLNKTKIWTKIIDWEESIDFFFEKDIRCTRKKFDFDCFVKKNRVDCVTLFAKENNYLYEKKINHQILSFRISLRTENKISPPITCLSKMVRLKKRKSFIYKDLWSFDFTIVWTDKNVDLAKKRPPKFEIEIEYIGDKNKQINIDYLFESLLGKISDFIIF